MPLILHSRTHRQFVDIESHQFVDDESFDHAPDPTGRR